ncbi:MAG: aspartyl-tRNA amidotransferase [SAR202 cluster bacterium Casp-Chloro-G4]|nr:GatB/YqeY domain-containing protein [Chloroflexota bacterium]MDA1228404.1 GatB/YqeY domain-containing protein [Chloroflexota bacterium]PKB62117.1 MAG: aspartyl-tRNA amidotransferase [SAR202 cluster bacterium Casp-Chloro-G4]
MPLKEQLNNDLKDAMRSGDTERRSTIRFLLSAIHNDEIAKQTELDDDGIIQVLTKQAQQRRDSITAFQGANRQDLVDKEQSELELIAAYLPEQMSEDEVRGIVQQVLTDTGASGPQDMGKVMGQLMPKVRGKADGKMVSNMVNQMLRGLAE